MMEPVALYLARMLDGYSKEALEDGAVEVAEDLAGAAKELRRLHDESQKAARDMGSRVAPETAQSNGRNEPISPTWREG